MYVIDISTCGLLAVAETFDEYCSRVDASTGREVDDHCWVINTYSIMEQ